MNRADVRAWVEGNRDAIVKLLCDMIAVDSVTGNEGPLAELCADWLRAHGIEVILQPAKDRQNVIGVVGGGVVGQGERERTLVLSGHLDTVPPNEGAWTHGPWSPTVADGRVYGLGSSDLHASIVGSYFAQRFFLEQGVELLGRYVTAFTIEEETTGDGTQLFLEWAEREGFLDFARTEAVVTEPTGLDHMCLGNRGSSFVVVEIRGLGGHGSRPHLSHNPLWKAMQVLEGVRELEERWKREHPDPEFGFTTLTPTSVNAGDLARTNVIPEVARLVIDCRPTPELYANDLQLFREGMAELFSSFDAEGYAITWEELYPREGQKLEEDHPLARTVLSVLREVLALPAAELRYTPAGNDAVFLAKKGIPTINKVGPGHPECAHRVDEFVTVENLLKGVELFVWIGLRRLGVV
ncbi:MAG: M20/M25/M40 family metallo-hydrolase [Planctomycetota bacterium]|nr:M20/M25/M40 family metallo-hydrolase [Planctomycetota bacterium]